MPMATPMSACFSAGASLIASPVIARRGRPPAGLHESQLVLRRDPREDRGRLRDLAKPIGREAVHANCRRSPATSFDSPSWRPIACAVACGRRCILP